MFSSAPLLPTVLFLDSMTNSITLKWMQWFILLVWRFRTEKGIMYLRFLKFFSALSIRVTSIHNLVYILGPLQTTRTLHYKYKASLVQKNGICQLRLLRPHFSSESCFNSFIFAWTPESSLYVDLIWQLGFCSAESIKSGLCWISLNYSKSWVA